MGVAEINERGVVHDGVEYPLDVLIYATGFQWMATSTFNMVVGREGRSLSEKWQNEGTKTFLGLHTHGFPNLFIITGPQGGGGSFNFTDAIDTHSDYVTWMLTTMREAGHAVIDVREEDEDAGGALPRGRPHDRATVDCSTTTVTAKCRPVASPTTEAWAGSGGARKPGDAPPTCSSVTSTDLAVGRGIVTATRTDGRPCGRRRSGGHFVWVFALAQTGARAVRPGQDDLRTKRRKTSPALGVEPTRVSTPT
jgi:hypothetical protein